MTANFHALAQIPKETPYSKNVNIKRKVKVMEYQVKNSF